MPSQSPRRGWRVVAVTAAITALLVVAGVPVVAGAGDGVHLNQIHAQIHASPQA
jgi:hypothetical protein